MSVVSRGFGRREQRRDERLPPGQYDAGDVFPVLSAGPTPHTPLGEWDLTLQGDVDGLRRWTWEEFRNLPREGVSVDIHCVTKWSKFDTRWEGVAVDTLLADVRTESACRASDFLAGPVVCGSDLARSLIVHGETAGVPG